ncbi:MAG: type II secretion system F family protein [Armatimonadota bacterium]
MRTFTYSYYDKKGKIKTATIEAFNTYDAKSLLIEQGIAVIDVVEGDKLPGLEEAETLRKEKIKKSKNDFFLFLEKIIIFSPKIKYDDFIIFLREFTVLYKSNINILRILEVLSENSRNATLKHSLIRVSKHIHDGSSISDAFAKEGTLYPSLFINLIAVGERGGNLAKILMDLADYYEKENRIIKKTVSSLVYPVIILIFAVLAVAFLTIYIFPTFASMFKSYKVELPVYTKILISLTDFIRNPVNLIGIFFTTALLFLLMGIYIKTPAGRYNIDKFILTMPGIGPVIRNITISRFTRALGTLYEDGINLTDSLDIAVKSIDNSFYRQEIKSVFKSIIDKGESISKGLSEKQKLFPRFFSSLIAVGEESGHLGYSLKRIASHFEEEVFYALDSMVAMIEPVIIFVLGIVILVIMLSLFMPLYTLVTQFWS